MAGDPRPCDPAVHATAIALARRCVAIIEPLLRQEEVGEALREFYLVIRPSLEAYYKEKPCEKQP
jgi:hypothetical protein